MIHKKAQLALPFVVLVVAAVVLGLAAQQKADDKATDPVCGMTVVKSTAKATYSYKGTTYYFCSTGCKDAFVKDPEKFLAKAEPSSNAPTGRQGAAAEKTPMKAGGCPMMSGEGQMGKGTGQNMGQGMGMGMNCPLMRKDVEWSVANTPDGVTISVTSKDPEAVKAIQEHFAKMKEMKAKMTSGPGKSAAPEAAPSSCGPNCPMRKADKK